MIGYRTTSVQPRMAAAEAAATAATAEPAEVFDAADVTACCQPPPTAEASALHEPVSSLFTRSVPSSLSWAVLSSVKADFAGNLPPSKAARAGGARGPHWKVRGLQLPSSHVSMERKNTSVTV
mmetsp:Transcript_92474/g.178206  ORF Transcript_92474/g.178206 Transcript_92474/m.178206 type:complete len:123 (+) Transcript_92474:54-422(+)